LERKSQSGVHEATILETFLAWEVCFPVTDHMIFFKELFFYPFKNYEFIYMYTCLFENLKAKIL